jgi:murein tripeptide amidase MpaA
LTVTFYSARLLLIILIDDGRPRKSNTWDEIVVMFRARDFKHAFERALQIGRSHEAEYRNFKGEKVRWALVEVVKLDLVGRKVEGREVASHLRTRRSKKPIAFSTTFHPEQSDPGQSF